MAEACKGGYLRARLVRGIKVVYWEREGRENTEKTVDLALKRAFELGIEHVVVASNTGATAKLLMGKGVKVVCVTHQVGFRAPGGDEMPPEVRRSLQESGVKIFTGTHLMRGIERAVTNKSGGLYPGGIVAETLRMLGEGTKVCVEISVMALDAGLIPYGKDVVAIAGTNGGADTALVIRPAHSYQFFDTKVREIICKPREF